MAKVKLTKNELKKQKDNLKRFCRYLPTLELKKRKLRMEINETQGAIDTLESEIDGIIKEVSSWVAVFADDINLNEFFTIKEIVTGTDNIAGVDVTTFGEVIFEDHSYDLFSTPLWVDKGLIVTKEIVIGKAKIKILRDQLDMLNEELRITVQRIKLFEKIKIPEAKENIRVIQIYLGDRQTAEVVRGKIAKNKINSKKQAALGL
jgi:V/A-type H+-transporting ATPase subunit D